MAIIAPEIRATETHERILDAALQAVTTFGLSRFTMDDVARVARISRQSVYRYFDSKDALVLALVEREEEALIEGVRGVFENEPDLEAAMRGAILFCLRTAREHPLLDRLLASEPEILLPYLTTRASGLVERARDVLEELAASRPGVDRRKAHRAADLGVRAVISYTLTPSDDSPETIAREVAHILSIAVQRKEHRR